jgi:hypothetical protein
MLAALELHVKFTPVQQPAGDPRRDQIVSVHNRSALQAIVERPLHHLQQAGKKYPGLWAEMDRLRARRAELGGWPSWCPLPAMTAYKDAHALGRYLNLFEISSLTALFAWRTTQGVYIFDETIFDELCSTPITGNIPAEALEGLPEWCVYIVFPHARSIAEYTATGVFAGLNYHLGNQQRDLNLVLDATRPDGSTYLAPACLPLAGTLEESASVSASLIQRCMENDGGLALGFASSQQARAYVDRVRRHSQDYCRELAPLISLLLYLTAANRDLRSGELTQPVRPEVRHTRRDGPRIFPPPAPRVWEVGYRIGATIRAGQVAIPRGHRSIDFPEGQTHASPRPHLRKAHYHRYWTGPLKGERLLIVKWVHPITVAARENGDPGIIPTVHRVAGPLRATAGAGSGLNQPAPEASRDNAARDR